MAECHTGRSRVLESSCSRSIGEAVSCGPRGVCVQPAYWSNTVHVRGAPESDRVGTRGAEVVDYRRKNRVEGVPAWERAVRKTPLFALLGVIVIKLFSSAAESETWLEDPITGCKIFSPEDRPGPATLISWSGACDAEGRAEGAGVLTWFEEGTLGGRYIGPLGAGKALGRGVLYMRSADGGYDRFEGEFRDSEIQGRATVDTANGTHFVGTLNSATMSGFGVVTRPSGDRYTGDIEDGQLQGEGYLERADGERYKGEFKANEPHGSGEWMNARGDYYEGQFVDGLRSGRGRLETVDGRVYEGEFVAGVPQGQGKYTAPDGGMIEGRFRSGWPDGEVLATSPEGDVTHERWADGKRVSE